MTSMNFPILHTDQLVAKLGHPGKKVKMVLDTDTYNEIDDQFAVIHALKSDDHIQVEALYAAPFYNKMSSGPEDGMERSYQEILKIRKLMSREDIPVYRGSTNYLQLSNKPIYSEAAQNLVDRAMATDPANPLYIGAIGAITNVASAILIEPRIIERIVVVWLGGHAIHWPDTKEFNLCQDLHASRLLFDCGVPLVLIPCMGVASHLKTSLSEIRDYVKDTGELGDYLYETYRNCTADHYAYSRVIWDIAVTAWLIEPAWCQSHLMPSPHISEDYRWSLDSGRHFIRYVQYVDRDKIFRDIFEKLSR